MTKKIILFSLMVYLMTAVLISDEQVFKDLGYNPKTITTKELEKLIEEGDVNMDQVQSGIPPEIIDNCRLRLIFGKTQKANFLEEINHMTGEVLYILRFYVGELPSKIITKKLKNAIMKYQNHIGHTPSGELSVKEFKKLSELYKNINPYRLDLPFDKFMAVSGMINIEGTWTFSDGRKLRDPVQTSKITGNKGDYELVEIKAVIVKNIFDNSESLSVVMDRWKVEKWNELEIVALRSSTFGPKERMNIDLKEKKVYVTRTSSGKENLMGNVKPAILELKSGYDVSRELNKEKLKDFREAFNPEYNYFFSENK